MRLRLLIVVLLIGAAAPAQALSRPAVEARFTGSAASRLPQPRAVTGVSWRLVSGIHVRGWKTVPPSLRFTGGQVVGSSGCNNYSAKLLRYEVATPVGTWTATYVPDGNALVSLPEGVEITLTFSAGGRLRGSAGCNSYTTTYTADLEHMRIRKPVSTRERCAVPEGVMPVERRFLRALPTTVAYTIDGSSMRLATASGTTAIFLERSRN